MRPGSPLGLIGRPLLFRQKSPSWRMRKSTSFWSWDHIRFLLRPSKRASAHGPNRRSFLLRSNEGIPARRRFCLPPRNFTPTGFDLEWSRVSPPGRFVRLPTYPWQRERFWIDDGREPHQNGATTIVDFDASCPTAGGSSKRRVKRLPRGAGERHGGFPHECSRAACGSRSSFRKPTSGRTHSTLNPIGISDLTADKRRERLIEYFRDRVAAVLELAPDKVDLDRPLLNLGLDSLTAMELKVEIDAFLGASLPLSMLLESGGIRELAESANSTPCRHSGQTVRDGRRACSRRERRAALA